MKKTTICVVLFAVFVLSGCHTEAYENLSERYESFSSLLNDAERSLYDDGQFADAAVLLSERLADDEMLMAKLQVIRERESVELFSEKDLMVFFRKFVYPRIEFFKFGREYDDMIN